MLDTLKPVWIKVAESEMRLGWMEKMFRRKLCVRELELFASAQNDQLRTQEMRFREEERRILLGLMPVKIRDERKNLRSLQESKEELKLWIKQTLGSIKKYKKLLERLKRITDKCKRKLKIKYNEKISHLQKERDREIEERREKIGELPDELKLLLECNVWKSDWDKRQEIGNQEFKIGKIELKLDILNAIEGLR